MLDRKAQTESRIEGGRTVGLSSNEVLWRMRRARRKLQADGMRDVMRDGMLDLYYYIELFIWLGWRIYK